MKSPEFAKKAYAVLGNCMYLSNNNNNCKYSNRLKYTKLNSRLLNNGFNSF